MFQEWSLEKDKASKQMKISQTVKIAQSIVFIYSTGLFLMLFYAIPTSKTLLVLVFGEKWVDDVGYSTLNL